MTFGVKVSQPGISVDQAADYQLAFSSEWPTLKIYKTAPLNLADISVKQTILSHNLGYPPAFMIQTTNTSGLARIAGPGNDELGNGFYVDSNTLGFDPNSVGSASGTYTGRVFIFTLNLLQNYQAPALTVGVSALKIGGVSSEGIMASIAGQNVVTSQPENLTIDSEARSPLVHLVTHGDLVFTGTDYEFAATFNLDYVPWYLSFASIQGSGTYSAFFGGNGNTIITTTPTSIKLRSTLSNVTGAVVILKDPFFL